MKYLLDLNGGNVLYREEDGNLYRMDNLAQRWEKCTGKVNDSCLCLSEEQAETYVRAVKLAHDAHRGQKDKGGYDYVTHPLAVSSFVKGSFTAVTAAFLHDVIEDTPYTLSDLEKLGFAEDIIHTVDSLTHRPDESRSDYLERVAADPDAIAVKLADLRHNSDLSRISTPLKRDFERIERYGREKEWLLCEKEKRYKKRPCIVISDQGREFLEKGQMWMYRNNAVSTDENAADGEIIDIVAADGTYIASGFYSPVSHIAVRILSRDRNEIIDKEFFRSRLQAAYDFRKTVEADNLTCCRLVFSDADLLPGVIIDRYSDVLVSQISCTGFEKRKELLYGTMADILAKDGQKITAVYERNDIAAREKEGLDQYKGFWNGTHAETVIRISENGLLLNVDIENGQKTGYFLDQKSNRMLIRKMAKGKKVLDCFTHTGGFALNAAKGNAEHVTAVDVSKTALAQAEANAELNGLSLRMDFVQADVFEYLSSVKPHQFDLIILDPPAFTKSRRTVMKAYNGYKRINKDAMKVLRGGGYLATCSCSRYMETHLFEQMLLEAAAEEHVLLRQVAAGTQNSDHPVLWRNDETSYLKFYVFQIV